MFFTICGETSIFIKQIIVVINVTIIYALTIISREASQLHLAVNHHRNLH
jgi:hypothetical protein